MYLLITAVYIWGDGMLHYPLVTNSYNSYQECRKEILLAADPLEGWTIEDGFELGMVAQNNDDEGLVTMFCAYTTSK